jgi:hypothetical protein
VFLASCSAAGALWAAGSPRAAFPVVMDCVCRDPRWDHQVEDRALYYARLFLGHGWPVGEVAGHLRSAADTHDKDEWRTGLAISVLGVLSRAGRPDALALLRDYVIEGWNWRWALDELSETGAPPALKDLADVLVARFIDQELADEVTPGWGPWDEWAVTQPRVRAAFAERSQFLKTVAAERQQRQVTRRELQTALAGDLTARVRGRGPDGAMAARELGRRGDLSLLDLAEELLPHRPGRPVPGLVPALLTLPADEAVRRARIWCRENRPYHDIGARILAEFGDTRDTQILIAELETCLAQHDWRSAVQPIEGIGRLRIREAAPLVSQTWAESAYSYLRPRALTALLAAAPGVAAAFAEEGLWDCEELTRQRSAETVPLTSATRDRLTVLTDDILESEIVRDAAAHRLREHPSGDGHDHH